MMTEVCGFRVLKIRLLKKMDARHTKKGNVNVTNCVYQPSGFQGVSEGISSRYGVPLSEFLRTLELGC